MKLLSAPLSLVVEYHGIRLAVPEGTKYIATDEDGAVYAYVDEPLALGTLAWTAHFYTEVGRADLEGMDWKDTLMTLSTEGE